VSSLFRGRKKQFAMKSIICGSTPRNISTVALPFVTRLKVSMVGKENLTSNCHEVIFRRELNEATQPHRSAAEI